MDRPTTEFTLRNGWKVTLIDYYTQGEYDELQKIVLDTYQYDAETDKMINLAKGSLLMEQGHRAKQLAVKKLVSPDGSQIFEGADLTIGVILSLPYDAEGDELKTLIDTHSSGKKKAIDAPSTPAS